MKPHEYEYSEYSDSAYIIYTIIEQVYYKYQNTNNFNTFPIEASQYLQHSNLTAHRACQGNHVTREIFCQQFHYKTQPTAGLVPLQQLKFILWNHIYKNMFNTSDFKINLMERK